MKKRKEILSLVFIAAYGIFVGISYLTGFEPGKQIGTKFFDYSIDVIKFLPCVMILLGLFEVWIKRETVIKHMGEASGIKGYLWAILLASTVVGGLYVTFPVAATLHKKGASLAAIFTYISAGAVCRIPMTLYEASFVGAKFTIIRILVSLPLVIIASIFLGNYLKRSDYKIEDGS